MQNVDEIVDAPESIPLAAAAQKPDRRRVLMTLSAAVALTIWIALIASAEPFQWSPTQPGQDAHAYWSASSQTPYTISQIGQNDAYLYSPAFLQLLGPIRALSWQAFFAVWTGLLIFATLYLVGPILLGAVLILAFFDVWLGNITLPLGLAIVLGFRWPATWAFVLLTKVTPGVGLVWFAVRREWHHLALALGATLVVIVISAAVGPLDAWASWFGVLVRNANAPVHADSQGWSLPVPLLLRLPFAVAIIAWGAVHNRRWVLPIGCLISLPVLWDVVSYPLLAAVIPLAPIGRLQAWLPTRWRPVGA